MLISVLIADDEPHARRYLKELLERDNEVGKVFECKNGKEVLDFLKLQQPDIIFLDINMPGITGIEVAEKLKDISSLIIFSTAYDRYALKAFELKAFDYLLKPFEQQRFTDVLEHAKDAITTQKQANFGTKFNQIFQEYQDSLNPHLTEILIREKGLEKRIKVSEIIYIEASSVYAIIYMQHEKLLYRVALNLLEQQLPPHFMRIHRSFILNIQYVESYKYLNNNTYSFRVSTGDILISSRKYKDAISKQLS